MKDFKFKLRDPRLSVVQRVIWGVIRSITVVILAPVLRIRRMKRGGYCEALVDRSSG